jgi:hypothetical protein
MIKAGSENGDILRVPQLHQYCRYHFLAIKNPNTMQELFKLVLGAFFRFVYARCKLLWGWVHSRFWDISARAVSIASTEMSIPVMHQKFRCGAR